MSGDPAGAEKRGRWRGVPDRHRGGNEHTGISNVGPEGSRTGCRCSTWTSQARRYPKELLCYRQGKTDLGMEAQNQYRGRAV